MENIEEKCSPFVERCVTAYSYKKQSEKNEEQLLAIIHELVTLVGSIEKNTMKSLSLREDIPTEDVIENDNSVQKNTRILEENIEENQSLQCEDENITILPIATQEELQKLTAKYSVFDAIPINKANIEILCTPVLAAVNWEYLSEQENILLGLQKSIYSIIEKSSEYSSSTTWELQE